MPPTCHIYLSLVVLFAVAAGDLAGAEAITGEQVIREVRSGLDRLAKQEE